MRCDYITTRGQCHKDSIPPSRFCEDHGTTATATIINQYRIACKLLGDAPSRHSQVDQIKSLRGEIAILRSALEHRLNTIETDAELIAAMPTLKDFALAVDKLATSCHTMDVKLGNLLNKQSLMALAQDIIQIIEKNVRPYASSQPSDEEIDENIEKIGREIVEAIATKEN